MFVSSIQKLKFLLISTIMLAAGVLGQDETTVTEVSNTTALPITHSTEEPMNATVNSPATTVAAVTEKLHNISLDLNGDLTSTTTEIPLTTPNEPTSPAVLPTISPVTEQSPEHVHVENQSTITPLFTTTTTTTKKPAPLVIQTTTLSPTTSYHEFPGKPTQDGENSTPRAPPPTPSTPAGVAGIGDLLKIPQIHLPALLRENALIDAIQKLG